MENFVKIFWEFFDGIDVLIWNVGNVRCEFCFFYEVIYMDWFEVVVFYFVVLGYFMMFLV